jgi:hypothetical protein
MSKIYPPKIKLLVSLILHCPGCLLTISWYQPLGTSFVLHITPSIPRKLNLNGPVYLIVWSAANSVTTFKCFAPTFYFCLRFRRTLSINLANAMGRLVGRQFSIQSPSPSFWDGRYPENSLNRVLGKNPFGILSHLFISNTRLSTQLMETCPQFYRSDEPKAAELYIYNDYWRIKITICKPAVVAAILYLTSSFSGSGH